MSRCRTRIPFGRRRFVVVVAGGGGKTTLLGRGDQAEGLVLFSGIGVDGLLFFLLLLLLLLGELLADVGQTGGSRMDSGSNGVDDVVESGIGRLLLREEMMRKWAVGRPQERSRRQTEGGHIAVSQSAVDISASLQFAQFRFLAGNRVGRRFLAVGDDVMTGALLLLLGGGKAGQSVVHQLGQRRGQFRFQHFSQTFHFRVVGRGDRLLWGAGHLLNGLQQWRSSAMAVAAASAGRRI